MTVDVNIKSANDMDTWPESVINEREEEEGEIIHEDVEIIAE